MKFYQRFLPYGVAIGSTAIALLLTISVEPFLLRIIGAFFYLAIIVTAWYGGWRPGSIAVVLSTVAIHYWFISPRSQLGIERPEDVFQVAIFFLVAFTINLLTSNFRDSKHKIEQLNQQLAQENTELLRIAPSAAQMGMWNWDMTTGKVQWSPDHELLFGLTPGTFDGTYETAIACLHPEDKECVNQALQQAIQNNSLYQQEFRVVWADDSIHWIEARGHAFYNKTGQPIQMTGTATLIDERKQAEAALQQREAILRLFAQYAPAAIAMLDRDMRYVMVSQRWVDQYNLDSIESLINRSHYEIFPEIPERWQQIHQRCLAGAIEKCDEDLFVRANGTQQWVCWEIHPWYMAKDEICGIIIFAVDITQRKQAQMALQKLNAELEQRVAERTVQLAQANERLLETISEQQYSQLILLEQSQLLDLAHETIMTRDLNGVITFWNQGAEQMYGWTQAEALGQDVHTFLHTQFPTLRTEIESELREQGYWEGELIHTRRDGLTITVASRWVMHKDELGKPIKVLEINNDISDRKRSEAQRQRAEAALKQAHTQLLQRTEQLEIVNQNLQITLEELEVTQEELRTTNQHLEDTVSVAQLQRQRYADLFNFAPDGYLVTDPVGVIQEANQAACNLLCVRLSALVGKPLSIYISYHERRLFRRYLSQLQQLFERQTYELTIQPRQSSPFPAVITVSITRDLQGQIICIRWLIKDISERKQAEVALQQQARQQQLLLNITQAIRQTLDLNAILNTTVTEVRQTLQVDRAAIYRFNPDWSGDFVMESVGTDWVKLVEPDMQTVWEDTYLQETQGGRFRNHESFVIADIYTAGLQPCHIELLEQFQAKAFAIAPIFSGEEVLWGLLAIYQGSTSRNWQSWEVELLQQIASQLAIAIQQSELYRQLQIELYERQQAAAVLREADRRWRSLLDNVQLIVVGLDRLGQVNYVNPFFLKLTGYTDQEVIGKNWFENFLPRSWQQQMQVRCSEVLTHHAYPYYQNPILTKSGEERFIAWNNTLLQDAEGNIVGTMSIGEDITERQKIEQLKNEFIGIVSHELRTPLTAIKMSLGLLKSGIYDKRPDKFQRMLDIALIDTNRLVNLVNDILDLERLESGRAVLEKTRCQAADLMQKAVDGVQPLATSQQIALNINPTDAEVWAAGHAIIQTLTNLLSNAIKFSPANSTITLSAECQTDSVLFQVSDRGRGIPADKLETIFGRFQQVDASDSRQKGGTGLGLSICRSIVEQHGGKIWAESTLGEGSTFFFTLPVLPEEIEGFTLSVPLEEIG